MADWEDELVCGRMGGRQSWMRRVIGSIRVHVAGVAVVAIVPLLVGACGSTSTARPHISRGAHSAPATGTASTGGVVPVRPAASARVSTPQALLAALVHAGAPGAVALVRQGGHVRTYTAGLAEVETREPMRAGLRFRVGSISKTVVAALVLKLVSEGRLGLSDTVARRLGGVLPAGGRITVTELLQQRSGLPDFTGTPQVGSVSRSAVTRVWTSRELLRTIAGRRLDFAPGTQFEYSNSNYLMLGLLIERVTRMPLERYAERTIFAPLQMRSTSFALGRVPGAHAHGYESQGPPFPAVPGGLRDVDVGNGSEWAAAGSLVSTAADLDRFFRALFTGRIIPRPLVVLMQATRLAQEGLGFDGYGLGLEATRTGCGTALGHGGSVWGYRAIVRASRTAEHVIVLLVNYDYSDLAGRAAVDRAGSALYCAR